MSMNIWNNHFNEEIFPNAAEFKPERWPQSNSKELERYLVPFGSGSRMRIGMKFQNSAVQLWYGGSNVSLTKPPAPH